MNFDKYKNPFDYTHERDSWREAEGRIHSQFKRDLEEENGFADNPKRDLLYGIAWDMGHSAGYSEVAYFYNELSPLIA